MWQRILGSLYSRKISCKPLSPLTVNIRHAGEQKIALKPEKGDQGQPPLIADYLLIRLAYEYARTMRATEVCSLRVKDFHIGTDRVYLHFGQRKGSNPTIQALMPRLPPYCWSGSRISRLKSSRFPSAVPHISRVRFFQLFRH